MPYNFDDYRKLIAEVDQSVKDLSELHKNHMLCKKGCDLCCMDYSVLPVEYMAIKEALKAKQVDIHGSVDGSCIFLKNHECQIYKSRPIICRTHGLPLLFMNDDQWELSACELNFTEFDDEEFKEENTFPQDTYNSKLFMINKRFIERSGLEYSNFDLLEISSLND